MLIPRERRCPPAAATADATAPLDRARLVNDRLLTAREVAELLGLSPSTVLDMWERGQLPGFKIGRAVRFRPSEVETWLEGCRRGPVLNTTPLRAAEGGAR